MSKMKLPKILKRTVNIDTRELNEEARTIEFPFSSELPVDRWFGREILSHKSGAMRMDRLNDSAPLLYNHNMDQYIGVIESADIRDGRGFCKVRFSTHEFADQIFQDIKSGILKNVSFGYRIHEMVLSKKGADGEANEYTATDFEPYEVSIVTIPADNSVGIGRALPGEDEIELNIKGEDVVSEPVITQPAASTAKKGQKMSEQNTPDIKVVQSEAAKAERERIAKINALGAKFKDAELSRQLVDSGKSIDEAREAFIEKFELNAAAPVEEGKANLDLTEKEKRQYSVVRAIRAAVSGNWKEAGFELALSQEIAKRQGKETAGFFMPMNIHLDPEQTRATYAVGAAATGGNLVATQLLAGSFIDILRNKSMVVQAGARMLSGLVGNVDIPRQNAATATYWVAEGSAITQSEATFDKVSLSPKQIGALSKMTRLMLQQGTPDIEALVRNDLAAVIALGIDAAAINGSGSGGVPRGILNQSGIGSVPLGANGAALTFDALIDLETAIATANADAGNMKYMTNAKQVGVLKKLKDSTNNYLWSGSTQVGMGPGVPGSINGYDVMRTNQIPGNLTKGSGTNLSAVIFGDFSQLVIGEWGSLEILPNVYGSLYTSGGVDIRAMQTVDIAVRQPTGFAAIVDAL